MSHQDRRAPLPADYQYPTPRANDPTTLLDYTVSISLGSGTGVEEFIREANQRMRVLEGRCCPCCGGPSTRGGICWNCLAETTSETPWGV